MQDFSACKVPFIAGTEPKLITLKKEIRKIVMVMKVATILLLAGLQVTANSWGQEKINLAFNNASLEQVFNAITAQTNIAFLYRSQYVKGKTVSINITNASLKTVLDLCLKGQQLTYEVIGKNVAIRPVKEAVAINGNAPPLIDIKGRVVNEKGEPVVDVTVTIKGTSISTLTDANGEFSLHSIDQSAVLVFTHVSMEAFEIKVSNKTELAISLKTKVSALGDVTIAVNTGYQKISSERFTGSFSQLDSLNFHRRTGMDIISRLDGTVPGVLFNKKGGTSTSGIQIRGISTLGNVNTPTDPLIVVDNFPMPSSFDITNINPNDVEGVTVLKDAAASSIWGSRAGNGVIVITTKKGKYSQRFRLDVSSNVTVEDKPDLYYIQRISAVDFIEIERNLFSKGFYDADINNTGTRPVISPVVEVLTRQKAGIITSAEADDEISALHNDVRDDLDKYVYRKASRQQHYLGFTGGTNTLAYQFSVGYNYGLNNTQNSKEEDKITINANTSFRPIKNLEIQTGINLALGSDKSNSFPIPNPISPYARLADDNGNPLAIPYLYRMGYIDTAGGGKLLDWHYKPLEEMKLANGNITTKFTRLNVGIGYQFVQWLKASISYQYQTIDVSGRNYKSLQSWIARDLINQFTNLNQTDPNLRYPVPKGGILDINNSLVKNYNVRGSFTFNKTISALHQLTALIGGEISDSKGGYGSAQRIYGYDGAIGTSRTNIDYYNYYPRLYAAFPGSVGYLPNNNSYGELTINRFVSAFANANYTYNNKYIIYASARKDGANIFGVNTNNKWKPLWSVGAGWEMSKEKFYHISWLPYVKLRSSYGYTGNSNNILSGRFLINYSISPDLITGLPYSSAGRAPNPDLKWEEVRIKNIGLDFQIINGRLTGSLDVFRKQSKDVISDATLAPSTGVSVYTLNYASMKTNGYEFSLNSKNINRRLVWNTSFGLSYAKTVITKVNTGLGKTATDFLDYKLTAVPDKVAYGISSYRWGGLDPLTGDPQGYYKGTLSKDYASIFTDSIQNQVFHGSAIPLASGYLRNDVSWNGITISINITGRFNYYFREPALTILYTSAMTGTSYLADYNKRWQKPGDESNTNVPSMIYPVPTIVSQRNQFYHYADIHVKRADNIRLQDIRLSYQWNKKSRNNKMPFQAAQIFFYPNNLNLIIWRADKSQYDPDFSGGIGDGIAGPLSKTWTTGITINF